MPVEFNLNSVVPGEALLVAIFNYATAVRETMTPENRARFDNINLTMIEDWTKFWKKLSILE